ncbi:TPM domain-containing protein [Empedobacter falsenii]|uniref:TPM domain-containing protein n=1 Tax=Empedobacter TaxID=59734 RepID=UPI002447496A|nr:MULTISPECIES: TPM domain-containing protein [Empedobacter]MDH1883166.1 TPM domain-containing protein [Empedobacter sp. GD03797]MDM1041861.1 TPM domain-containing protein [Empedobacter brevis]MDM1135791.1 TPM domain-containing protein [Empedobacter sp. R750]
MIRKILLSVLLCTNITFSHAQDYDQISKEICKSITKDQSLSGKIKFPDFRDFIKTDADKFLISDVNVFQFNLQKSLIKNCTEFPFIENYSLVPFSNVVDLEKVFNREDLAKLEKQLKEIQKTSRFQLFIISTDDYFPNENITDYSFSILNNNSSDLFQKGNMIIVFNLKSREVRISTNKIAQNIISDEFSQKLIDEIIVPNFSEEKYFEGINEAIVKINEKIVAED